MSLSESNVCDVHRSTDDDDADKGCQANSSFHNGLLCETSLITRPNFNKALTYYKQAARLGHKDALYHAAIILYCGTYDVKKNIPEALELLQLFIDHPGHSYHEGKEKEANANFYIAWCYYNGLEVERNPEKAFRLFKLAAGQGQSEAQCHLGNMYSTGEFVKQNHKTALDYFEKAASKGDPVAKNNLAVYYHEGLADNPDPAKAEVLLMEAASTRNPVIQLNIGKLFRQGLGGNKDLTSSLYWMVLSGSQRFSKAQYEVGFCHLYGLGTIENHAEAALWLTKSVNNDGNPAAIYTLGLMHMQGKHFPKNELVAFKHFMKSAQQSYSKAQTQVGLCYLDAIGTTKDLEKAEEYLEKSAHNDNNPSAQYYLGYLYSKRKQNIEVNQKLAFHWYLKSAFQKFSDAANATGKCYLYGLGTTQDYGMASFWFRESISINENTAGQYNLGLMYYHGWDFPVNYKISFLYFTKSAEKGCSNAENQVGLCYLHGRGTPKDVSEALKWFRRSISNNNNSSAQCNMGNMYLRGLGVTKNDFTAFEYFTMAADQLHSEAYYKLGRCFQHGSGTTQNFKKAKNYYELAAYKQKNPLAQYSLGCLYLRGDGVPKSDDSAIFWLEQAANQGLMEAKKELEKLNTDRKQQNRKQLVDHESTTLQLLQREKIIIKPFPFSVMENPLDFVVETRLNNFDAAINVSDFTFNPASNFTGASPGTSTSTYTSNLTGCNINSSVRGLDFSSSSVGISFRGYQNDPDKFFHVENTDLDSSNINSTSTTQNYNRSQVERRPTQFLGL